MRRWWYRLQLRIRCRNGEVAAAIRDAEKQRTQAHEQTPMVNRIVLQARGLTRRTNAFIEDVENSWRPKESR